MIIVAIICTVLGGVLGAFLEPVSFSVSIPFVLFRRRSRTLYDPLILPCRFKAQRFKALKHLEIVSRKDISVNCFAAEKYFFHIITLLHITTHNVLTSVPSR